MLDTAAVELRASVPEDEVRVRGVIVRLHREGDTGPGDVTIDGSISGDPGRLRRIQVNLSQDDYNRAIEAHRRWLDVEVVGSLITRGTRSRLQPARGFSVIPEVRDLT